MGTARKMHGLQTTRHVRQGHTIALRAVDSCHSMCVRS